MTTPRLPFKFAVAAAVAAVGADGVPLQRIKLLPMGPIRLRDGRGPFRLADRAHADKVVAASLAVAGATDLPIDYDHQLMYAVQPGQGGRAAAAGWMSNLHADDDGIWADAQWTAAASTQLVAREYRYLSPVFSHDKAGNVLSIACAGLVNIPAITDLPAVAAAATMETDSMKTIAAALGLADDADEPTIIAAIAALKAVPAADVAAAATVLGLAATATVGQVVAAAARAELLDPKKFAPIAEITALTDQLGKINGERAEIAVCAAMNAGKLIPAQKERMIKLFLADEADFREWEKTAPPIVAAGALNLGDPPKFDGTAASLTKAELAVCSATGITPEQFVAAKAKEA